MAKKKIDSASSDGTIKLPSPDYVSSLSCEQALRLRRSRREFTPVPLKVKELSQLLWAGQGITGAGGLRTAPSAGETFPLETYVVIAGVETLEVGFYRYINDGHRLRELRRGDFRQELAKVALEQQWVLDAAVIVVLAAVAERTSGTYGERGIRYVHMEAGAAGQNLNLQAVSLGLGSVFTAAFDDAGVSRVLELPAEQKPLLLVPIGNIP